MKYTITGLVHYVFGMVLLLHGKLDGLSYDSVLIVACIFLCTGSIISLMGGLMEELKKTKDISIKVTEPPAK